MKPYESININAEKIASTIYSNIGEEMPSILSLLKWMEESFGIRIEVFYSENKLAEMHCSGLVHFEPTINGYRIWINSKDYGFRQNFTECHEIAHIIRNMSLKYGFSTGEIYSKWGEERFCDRFAAAFLMPADKFIHIWKTIKEPIYLKKA
ncbi:MAG: hypothetical protein COX30_03455 [Candidatus Moranbacteria bacterium CG23_combo_of_CG06-09_8_20_14_all_39_10]|nr:MAG: hypothetical protein COX30_03455 [Candidatus Moranbacteria bacterium CG23_combo_of_CG06-09_8_20_14_all_39_10]